MADPNAHLMPARRAALRLIAGALALLPCCPVLGYGPSFSAHALRGVKRVTIVVEGVPDDAARYGLTAGELERQVAARLAAYGIEVIAAEAARADRDASQLSVKLTTNVNPYALYHYAVSVQLQRKVPLDATGTSYVGETVWSQGESGVLNPSDLMRVYGVVANLTDAFIAAHDADNVASHAVSGL